MEVITNDPAGTIQILTITGTVEILYSLSPKRIRLEGVLGTPIKATATLTTQEKYPLKITEVKAKNGDNIKFKLSEEKEGNISRYTLAVESVRKTVGNFADTLVLKTDNPSKPEIELPLFGYIIGPSANASQQ